MNSNIKSKDILSIIFDSNLALSTK